MNKSSSDKRANLRDVARLAGVSPTTVSRFLNDPDAVAPDTQETIRNAIDQLSFRRSPAARAINSGRTKVIGALIPTIDNMIFARVLHGIESALTEKGFSLIVATTNEDPQIEARKARELIDIGAEGLIISGITHDPALLETLERQKMPAVSISYFDPGYSLPTIGYDNAYAARIAAEHLRDLGHRRVAVVHGPEANNDRIQNRLAGLHAGVEGLEFTYFPTEYSVAGGCEAACRILDDAGSVTACLCLSDVLAMGVMFEFQRRGMSIPEDMSVSGMEGQAITSSLSPRLTTVRLSIFDMGLTVGNSLIGWVVDKVRPDSMCMPAEIVARESTAAPRKDG